MYFYVSIYVLSLMLKSSLSQMTALTSPMTSILVIRIYELRI
jgi:hypothetical protein